MMQDGKLNIRNLVKWSFIEMKQNETKMKQKWNIDTFSTNDELIKFSRVIIMTNLNRIRNNQLTYLKVFRSSYLTNNIQDLDILPRQEQ